MFNKKLDEAIKHMKLWLQACGEVEDAYFSSKLLKSGEFDSQLKEKLTAQYKVVAEFSNQLLMHPEVPFSTLNVLVKLAF